MSAASGGAGFNVEMTGLSDLSSRLKDAESQIVGPSLSRLTAELAKEVAADARRRLPSATGAARSSVAVMSSDLDHSVVYGGSRAPYTAWLDFGGTVGIRHSVHRPYMQGGRALFPALSANQPVGMSQADDMVYDALAGAGIDTEES